MNIPPTPDFLSLLDQQPALKKRVFTVFEGITWVALLGICALYLVFSDEIIEANRILLVASVILLFLWGIIFFRWIVPRSKHLGFHFSTGMLIGMLALAAVERIFTEPAFDLSIIYAVIIATCGLLTNWRLTFMAILFAAVLHTLPAYLELTEITSFFWAKEGLHIFGFVIAGTIAQALSGVIRQQTQGLYQKNRNLAMLLDASRLATEATPLEETLSDVTQLIVAELPTTMCKICLLDDQEGTLATKGFAYQRQAMLTSPGLKSFTLAQLREMYPNIESENRVRIILRGQPRYDMLASLDTAYLSLQSLAIVPLIEQGRFLGVLQVGEARRWNRTPFDMDRVNLLETLGNQLAVAIHNNKLYRFAQQQYKRMSVLNEVARAIGSTIEFHDLLELIYEQLKRVLSADTYYVATYNQEESTLEYHILIDDGQRFPPDQVPIGDGFGSYVILNQQPLLVRHLTEEIDQLPVKPLMVGQDRQSESWLGVPLMTGDHLLGMLAIASYNPNEFSQEDVTLLTSLAQQAALALDNAGHHHEVEEQAMRDSLTGAFNHGTFLKKLKLSLQQAAENSARVGLIMIDVDYFKQYNDNYGHVVGDRVLVEAVRGMQAALAEHTGYVGRWGGEEFAVAVEGADEGELLAVTQSIQQELAALEIMNSAGQVVPPPTISQGIAIYPVQAVDLETLVLLADQTLYQAKTAGRNQVLAAR